jgi:hypothetical protein
MNFEIKDTSLLSRVKGYHPKNELYFNANPT